MMAGSVGSSGSASSVSAKKQRKERTSVCSFCSLTFNKKEHLQRHERTHTLDRPYICDFADCGKTFARRDTLTRHTRLHKRDDASTGAEVPSSSSSLSIPKPARKRRARNGSATSTLAHDDSAEGEDPTSSSAEADDDPELDHKAPASRLQSLTLDFNSGNNSEEDKPPVAANPAFPTAASFPASWLKVGDALAKQEEVPGLVDPQSASSLGLDIALPATAGPASFPNEAIKKPTTSTDQLPAFVQATRDHFRIFRPSDINSNSTSASIQSQQQQQQLPSPTSLLQPTQQLPSPGQQPGWQQQSFLAGCTGRPNLAQFSQFDRVGGGVRAGVPTSAVRNGGSAGPAPMSITLPINPYQQAYRQRQISQDFFPVDDMASVYSTSPASGDSFLSMGYSTNSPASDHASLPTLSSSVPVSALAGVPPYYIEGSDISAFKNANAFNQPMTMSLGLPARRNKSIDSDSKQHLYMLMRATETPTDEFLRWPSREASPALGMSFSSAGTDSTTNTKFGLSSSISSSAGSSSGGSSGFLEFHEYDSTQAALFGDKTMTPNANNGSRSPIASLEEWLVRQSSDSALSAHNMVF